MREAEGSDGRPAHGEEGVGDEANRAPNVVAVLPPPDQWSPTLDGALRASDEEDDGASGSSEEEEEPPLHQRWRRSSLESALDAARVASLASAQHAVMTSDAGEAEEEEHAERGAARGGTRPPTDPPMAPHTKDREAGDAGPRRGLRPPPHATRPLRRETRPPPPRRGHRLRRWRGLRSRLAWHGSRRLPQHPRPLGHPRRPRCRSRWRRRGRGMTRTRAVGTTTARTGGTRPSRWRRRRRRCMSTLPGLGWLCRRRRGGCGSHTTASSARYPTGGRPTTRGTSTTLTDAVTCTTTTSRRGVRSGSIRMTSTRGICSCRNERAAMREGMMGTRSPSRS